MHPAGAVLRSAMNWVAGVGHLTDCDAACATYMSGYTLD